MNVYKPRKRSPLRFTADVLRGITKLLTLWPLLLVCVFFFSPISPHMRWTYTYQDYGQTRNYHRCEYIGPDGLVPYMHGDTCPFITLINRDRH